MPQPSRLACPSCGHLARADGWATSCEHCGKVALHDVLDAEAFVQATINRARLVLQADEREELVAEGLAIMCRLAADFEPVRDGYAVGGRFSGYAAQFLPRKLGDAWHRMHPEHALRVDGEGKRRWHYGPRAVSIQALEEDDAEERLQGRPQNEEPMPNVETLLRESLEEQFNMAMRVAGMFAEGVTSDREVADVLGMTTAQVRHARTLLEPVAQRLATLNAR